LFSLYYIKNTVTFNVSLSQKQAVFAIIEVSSITFSYHPSHTLLQIALDFVRKGSIAWVATNMELPKQ